MIHVFSVHLNKIKESETTTVIIILLRIYPLVVLWHFLDVYL